MQHTLDMTKAIGERQTKGGGSVKQIRKGIRQQGQIVTKVS